MVMFIVGHGGKTSERTFIEAGRVVRMWTNEGVDLDQTETEAILRGDADALKAINYGKGDQISYIQNYRISAGDSTETARWATLKESCDYDLLVAGVDFLSDVRLCEDPGGCANKGTHECNGLLGMKHKEIGLLSCRGGGPSDEVNVPSKFAEREQQWFDTFDKLSWNEKKSTWERMSDEQRSHRLSNGKVVTFYHLYCLEQYIASRGGSRFSGCRYLLALKKDAAEDYLFVNKWLRGDAGDLPDFAVSARDGMDMVNSWENAAREGDESTFQYFRQETFSNEELEDLHAIDDAYFTNSLFNYWRLSHQEDIGTFDTTEINKTSLFSGKGSGFATYQYWVLGDQFGAQSRICASRMG
jgi:hypothetical protein